MQLTSIEGRIDEGSFKGAGVVDITKSEPQYRFKGRAQNLAWKGGRVDLDGSMQTLGAGLDLLLNLRAEGAFQARNIVLAPEQTVKTATGEFVFSLTGKDHSLSCPMCRQIWGRNASGDGITLADGRLQMELASASRTVRVNMDAAR